MRLRNRFATNFVAAIMVTFLIRIGTAAPNRLIVKMVNNADIVDLILIFDLVPRHGAGTRLNASSSGSMKKWVDDLWLKDDDHLGKSINSSNMRVSVAAVKANGETKIVIPLKRGSTIDGLVNSGSWLGSIDTSTTTPNNVNATVAKIKNETFNTEGDRGYVPNLVVYIGMYPYEGQKSVVLHLDATKPRLDSDFGAVDIVLLFTDWQDNQSLVIAYKGPEGTFTPLGHENQMPFGHKELVSAIQTLLGRCPAELTLGDSCYYNASYACVYTDIYKPLHFYNPTDFRMTHCLRGNYSTRPCEDKDIHECDLHCRYKEKWSDCDCDTSTKTRNITEEELLADFLICPPKPSVEPCERPFNCPQPDETPVLAMPVWAVFATTFFVVLIVVVILTLFVYYAFFPYPEGYLARASGGRQVGDTMLSVVQSARTRGDSRGRSQTTRFGRSTQTTGKSYTRGASQSTGGSYVNVSRPRK